MKETSTKPLQSGVKLQSKDRTYEIVKVLGVGSFGITYLATASVPIGNITTTIKFAIKEYFLSDSCYRGDDGVSVNALANEKAEVARNRLDFINEANRLKKICHKSRNIVSVNETFEANGTAYYVMEYLDGGNPSKCSEEEAVSIIMQIADALEKIHEEGVMHMDLRPDNIVMKTNEKHGTYPVLIDFGISLYFDPKSKSGTTLTIKGASPGYSPPEQLKESESFSPKCEFSPKYDIYALGAILFYLCTGKNPPNATDISEDQSRLKQVLSGAVSKNVETAIINAMKQNSQERTQTIKKFRDDLLGVVFVPVLDVNEKKLDFSKEKSNQAIEVKSNIDWKAYADEDWCKVEKKDDAVIVSVSKNSERGARTCNVFINGLSESISQLIHVKQSGAGTVIYHDDDTWWMKHSKKVYVGLTVVLAICSVIGVAMWIKSFSKSETENIADVSDLTNLDSTSQSYYEVVEAVEEEPIPVSSEEDAKTQSKQEEEAPQVVEEQPVEETNDAKFARASRTNDMALMLTLAKANYAKAYYPVALNYFNNGNKFQAESWAKKAVAANVNRTQAQSLLDKINPSKPAKPTDDELFAKATTIAELKALADKGYAKAYAPLADKYFSQRNYAEANKYVRKALSTNEGRKQAINVVEKLDIIGYYDNGENGGKPNY